MSKRLPGRSGSILLAALVLCAACGTPVAGTPLPSATPTTTATPATVPSPSPTSTCADRVFAGMTEDQRIGQLFLLGLAANQLGPAELTEIRADHVGSVWFVDRTSAGAAAIRAVAAAVQAEVSAPATANVRFFVAANQEGDVIQALQGPGFSSIPSAVVQGGWATSTLEARATTWGQELHAAGVNLNFAPVMDVVPPGFDAQNQPIGALQREYGHDPATVGSQGTAFLQGMHQAGMAVTLKHFPGLGRVTGNTDYTTATDGITTTNDPYLQSFKQGIRGGADFVMVAIATFTRIDASHLAAFSPIVIGQMLRGSVGFQGVIVSDDLGATAAVASIPAGDRALAFLSAGGDLVISKTAVATHAMVLAVRSRAAADPVFLARVNDAAVRILRAKQEFGLLPC
jgi:beta-N-acetylhexosaminidase